MNNQSELLNEKVRFGRFTTDRIIEFGLEEETDIRIESIIRIEGGVVSISIISPSGENTFRNNENTGGIKVAKIHADAGLWKCKISCDNALNGEYSVCVKKI